MIIIHRVLKIHLCVSIFFTSVHSQTSKYEIDNSTLSRDPRGGLMPFFPKKTLEKIRPSEPWGGKIIVGDGHGLNCKRTWVPAYYDTVLLDRVIAHVGKKVCVPYQTDYKKRLQDGRLDIFGEPRWLLVFKGANFLYPHAKSDICMVVKRNDPQRKSILMSFSYLTWAATCMGVAEFGLAFWTTGLRNGVALETFRTFIFGNFKESRSPIRNFLAIMLSVFGVIMISAFAGQLMSFLAVSGEAPQLQTLEEVDAQVHTVYSVGSAKSYTTVYTSGPIPRLMAKTPRPWFYEEMVGNITTSPKYALVFGQDLYDIYRRHPDWIDNKTGRSLTHMVPECIVSPAHSVFIVSKHWKHRERFSSVLQHAVEAGLNFKAKSDLEYAWEYLGKRVRETIPTNKPQPLSMAAMLEPGIVLSTGIILAISAFVVELCAMRACRHRSRIHQSIF